MKVFASDLDGTLFFRHLDPPYKASDFEAIRQFQKEGHLFGCCTGRALYGASVSFVDLLDLDFYIASSGAVIADRNLNVIYGCPIPFDIAKEIYEKYKDVADVYMQTLRYYAFDKNLDGNFFTVADHIDLIKDQPIYSISLISDNNEVIDRINKEIPEYYSDLVGFKNVDAVDVVPKGCSKGEALKKVKELFKADMSYGIGDSYNDIPLLDDADVSFTFHTSPKEVQSHADKIIDSVEEAIGQIK